jgi:hypothetical protein
LLLLQKRKEQKRRLPAQIRKGCCFGIYASNGYRATQHPTQRNRKEREFAYSTGQKPSQEKQLLHDFDSTYMEIHTQSEITTSLNTHAPCTGPHDMPSWIFVSGLVWNSADTDAPCLNDVAPADLAKKADEQVRIT